MKMAKVKFHILVEYETTLTELTYNDCPEDNMTVIERIALEKEYLETQREDLYSALEDSELIKVTVEETEHYEVPDIVINYSI